MATLEEIRQIDRETSSTQFHEHTSHLGYRFSKDGPGLVLERIEHQPPKLTAARMITPFRDATHAYDLAASERHNEATVREWDRRRRQLAHNVDDWLDTISLRDDRMDAYRCWSFGDLTPHLICRYSEPFRRLIAGTSWEPPMKFLALGRAVNPDTGIVELGSTLTADTLEDLARQCLVEGTGITIDGRDFTVEQHSFLVMDLDRTTTEEGTFSQFREGLENGFRLW